MCDKNKLQRITVDVVKAVLFDAKDKRVKLQRFSSYSKQNRVKLSTPMW